MSGGIAQLLSLGVQDTFIVGNPEVSYFRSVYTRHTNFSHTVEQETIEGNVQNNGTSTVRFARKGDLLSYVYFTIDVNNTAFYSTDWTTLIDKVELLIGGRVIDKQDSFFTERIAIDALAQTVSKSSNGPHPGSSGAASYFYPLRFWFCESWQSALPLIALQYHDVELRITWGASASSYTWKCWSDYVYLDFQERSKIVGEQMDMLIYQVQKTAATGNKIQELVFSHPVKFLASSNTTTNNSLTSTTNKIKLQINGVDISDFKFGKPNFVDVPAYYHCTNVTSPDTFLYSFALNTSSLQPSGTLNFSRLDSAYMISETDNIVDPIYAVNYNILHFENGMAGLLYAD
jgi:hypothetical protein